MGLALRIVEIACSHWVIDQIIFFKQGAVQTRAKFEALLSQLNGRLHEGGPRQSAMFFVRHFKHREGARNAYRQATDNTFNERKRFAIGIQKKLICCGRGRNFAAVIGFYFFAIVVEDKCATPNATRLGFNQSENHLNRNGRIDGRTASSEHLIASIGGQRVCCCNGKSLRGPARLFLIVHRIIGLIWRGVIECVLLQCTRT